MHHLTLTVKKLKLFIEQRNPTADIIFSAISFNKDYETSYMQTEPLDKLYLLVLP
jgi:hypothetical protein